MHASDRHTRALFPGYEPDPRQAWHQSEQARDVDRKRQQRASSRDVILGTVEDPQRRERCEADLELWLRTYQPRTFPKPFSAGQKSILRGIEDRTRSGGMQLYLAPRGFGKTTILRGAQLANTLAGRVRYSPIIAKSGGDSQDILIKQKTELVSNDTMLADYPELACFRALGGIAQRAAGMTVRGELVNMAWQQHYIRMPWIDGVRSSGSVISATGFEGGSLRGISISLADGRVIRPDMVLLDDLQDDESAYSVLQTEKILSVIEKAILGGRGHGERGTYFGAMTVIAPNDVADRLANRDVYPQWSAIRQRALESMPARTDLWEQYYDIITRELYDDTNKISSPHAVTAATEFYRANRDEMRREAVVTNDSLHLSNAYAIAKNENRAPAQKDEPTELDSLQYLMNLRYEMGDEAFEAELNNNPRSLGSLPVISVSPRMVLEKTTRLQRGVAPEWTAHLTAGIDVGKSMLHVVIIAWSARGNQCHIVDYAEVPVNPVAGAGRRVDDPSYAAIEHEIVNALRRVRTWLDSDSYRVAGGETIPISAVTVDAGYHPTAVNRACNERREWTSSMGRSRKDPPARSKRVRPVRGGFYKLVDGRWLLYHDADYIKRRIHEGIMARPGEPGALTLFGPTMERHRTFADHLCAEIYIEKGPGDFRYVDSGSGADNHFLDAAALCVMGASILRLHDLGAQSAEDEAAAAQAHLIEAVPDPTTPNTPAESAPPPAPAPSTIQTALDHASEPDWPDGTSAPSGPQPGPRKPSPKPKQKVIRRNRSGGSPIRSSY